MWPRQRFELATIIACAIAAVLAVAQRLTGAGLAAASTATIIAALALAYWRYARLTTQWVTATYQLMGECQLTQVREQVDAQLRRASSPVSRDVLRIMRAEALLWSGELDAALAEAKSIDVAKLHRSWHRPVWGTQVAALMFLGRAAEAHALLEAHREVLSVAPGFHQLEAAVALKLGEPQKASALMSQRGEDPTRPPLLKAARALLEAEVALALDEAPRAQELLKQALELGAGTFAQTRAAALLSGLRP